MALFFFARIIMGSFYRLFPCVILLLVATTARADDPAPDDRPDPAAVQRYGSAYRYPQAGWIVLHIEGEPYERGFQHGKLMAQEIAAYLRCFASVLGHEAPSEAWSHTRKLVNALFLRKVNSEYLEEMKGIASGATAAGAKIYGRPIDLVDIVTLNSWMEIETLDEALAALPTGLEGKVFKDAQPRVKPQPRPEHCSAFAATGPATADGKIVFGHITMSGLPAANFSNVWLDIKPAKGHRVLMCAFPGAIQSGMDYYINDAGLLIAETTITQTRFNPQGQSEASRIRQAIQYAATIDEAVAILDKEINGLYTNEWLLGDINTNEIALFEQGTAKTKLHRSSKNEWIGGTTGFYWGCNNTKDLELRLETIPSVSGRPANLVFHPSERDLAWQRLYQKYNGKIDVNFAKEAFTSSPLAAIHSLDAKFTTSEMAKKLQSWALFGPPQGRTWEPTANERQNYPEIKPLVSNPWTILNGEPPPAEKALAADITYPDGSSKAVTAKSTKSPRLLLVPAWHGTILPAGDGDIWLATAFADYERIVAKEKTMGGSDKKLTPADREELALELFAYRNRYLTAAAESTDIPALANIKADIDQDRWYRLASGKGVLVLHELHRLLGDPLFEETMDSFGRKFAGQKVTTSQFEAHLKEKAGKKTDGFIAAWVKATQLPNIRLSRIEPVATVGSQTVVQGEILRDGLEPPVAKVDVTVETASGEFTKTIELKGARTEFSFSSDKGKPKHVILNKYGETALAGMRGYSVHSYVREQDHTLVVYGTGTEMNTNREGAEALQKAIRLSGQNFTVPVKADKDVTDDDIKNHHVLLIGRPDNNSLVKRFEKNLPITYGQRSFKVQEHTYAHPESAVIVAAENPLSKEYSLVVVSGLSAYSMRGTAPKLATDHRAAEVVVMPHGEASQYLILASRAP
jgi:hypothetical protein